MLLEDALERRHSTTEFTERFVLHRTLHDIIRKSLATPSFNNRHNIHLVVVHQEENLKNTISDYLKSYSEEYKDIIASAQAKYISTASVLILIYKEKSKNKTEEKEDLITLGALGQNICLLATNHYLGTLWVDRITKIEDNISDVLKIDPKFKLCYGIVLGYRDRIYSYQRDGIPQGDFVKWY